MYVCMYVWTVNTAWTVIVGCGNTNASDWFAWANAAASDWFAGHTAASDWFAWANTAASDWFALG